MTRARVRIPTVLRRAEQPFLEVIFDEEAFRLSLDEARRARDWLAFAGAWLRAPRTGELGDALERARGVLADQPPRRIDDHVLGALQGELSSGEPVWLQLSVESGLRDPAQPRIQLSIGELLAVDEEPFYGDTWWIDAREATELASLIRAGSGALADFLHVRAARDPAHERTDGIELRFADDLLEEQAEDGILWLAQPSARRVADWLDAAVDYARTHPPHVWLSPEPDTLTVAELTL